MPSLRRVSPLFVLALALLAGAATRTIDSRLYLDDVKFLASPELRGRAAGTAELDKAADYIAAKFRDFGLQPVDGSTYFQPFQVTTSAALGNANRLQLRNGRPAGLRIPEDYIPLNISSAGRLAGPLVFVGYGITAPEYRYDDYAGVDVKGKVVLMLRHEPQENDEGSVFAGKALTPHATLASKASNAKMHGATGVVLVNDRAAHGWSADELEKFGSTQGPFDSGVPVVHVKEQAVARLFPAGKSPDAIQASIDRTLTPQSFPFPDSAQFDGFIDVQRVQATVRNVAAYLPGETSEYIVFGAHYDHIGLGGPSSLAPSKTGQVHHGADDNASGAAGVLALGRWFASQPKGKRGILFLAFAAEEIGLLGSSYYVAHPTLPLENAAVMINMDMIGRVRESKAFVGGAATGSNLRELLQTAAAKRRFTLDLSENAGFSGSSDHISFAAKAVPSLFFFSGLHADYHKPSDTWDKITSRETADLLGLIADVGAELRDAPVRPQFTSKAPVQGEHAMGSTGGSSGYGAYFGSIPDFGEGVQGVKFADVREGSPAAKAGLRTGDILVEFAGKPIGNLYDFTYALRAHKPGDTVRVKVLRGSSPVEAEVSLTARQ